MKNKLLTIGLVFLIIAVGFVGCKKGENDPSFTLTSRNSKIVGTWKLNYEVSNYTNNYSRTYPSNFENYNFSSKSTGNANFDGTNRAYTQYSETTNGNNEPDINSDTTYSYPYTLEITINEDGTYKIEVSEDGDKTVTEGYWWWLDSDANKVRIAFDDDINSMRIDRLAKDELFLIEETSSNSTSNQTDMAYNSETGEYEEVELTITSIYSNSGEYKYEKID